MRRAYIVTLDIPDNENEQAYSDIILDILEGEGLSVIDVDMWSTHSDQEDLGIMTVLRNQADKQANQQYNIP